MVTRKELGDVDADIAAQAEPFWQTLNALRSLVREEVPEAEELISYGIPCFKHHTMLVGIGVTKRDCSFYTMNPDLVKRMRDDLRGIKHAGATLRFPPGEPLPEALLRRIIRIRVRENEEKAGITS